MTDVGTLVKALGQQKLSTPTFNGSEDVRKFAQRFEEVAEFNDWGKMKPSFI